MPAPVSFTQAAIEALAPPARGRARYRDARQPGLVLVVQAGGARTWFLYKRADGMLHEVRIGPYPAIRIEQARAKAAEMLAAIARGESPTTKPRGRDNTFAELWSWWMDEHARPRRATWPEAARVYAKHLAGPLGNRQLRLITKGELRQLHVRLGQTVGERSANVALGLVRAAWNKALAHDWTSCQNPAIAVEHFRRPARDRRLTAAEAPRFFAALDTAKPDLRDFVLLSLFTGARRGNVLAMRWDEIDEAGRTWRIPRTKNGRSQIIPLEDAELAILAGRRGTSPWVFPARAGSRSPFMTNPQKGWSALLARAGIEDFHVHDLRRSLGSWMVDTGASLPVIGHALGHASPSATAIYARLALDPVRDAKRKALAALSEAAGP